MNAYPHPRLAPSSARGFSLLKVLDRVFALAPGAAIVGLLAAPIGAQEAKPELDRANTGKRAHLFVTTTEQGYFLDSSEGPRLRLELPEGARLEDFATSSQGWTAAAIESKSTQPRLVLRQSKNGLESYLPAPPFEDHQILASARLLMAPGGLRGLAWLEGDDPRRLSVHAAAFDAGQWGESMTVAGPGPGSQVSLSAAWLGDGSWLLAWSAYDGQDDEILWSRFSKGQWSEAKRACCNNTVPDITPSLTAVGERGALLAFSHFDGAGYRVMLSRFDGKGWTAERPVGPRGSVRPSLKTLDGEPLLLYRRPALATWTIAELAASGEVKRRADLPVASTSTPALARRTPQGLELSSGGETERVDWRAQNP